MFSRKPQTKNIKILLRTIWFSFFSVKPVKSGKILFLLFVSVRQQFYENTWSLISFRYIFTKRDIVVSLGNPLPGFNGRWRKLIESWQCPPLALSRGTFVISSNIVGFPMTSLKFKLKKLWILPRFYFHDAKLIFI